jgi:hypothetical protein
MVTKGLTLHARDYWRWREMLEKLELTIRQLDDIYYYELEHFRHPDSADVMAACLDRLEEVAEALAAELGLPAELPESG